MKENVSLADKIFNRYNIYAAFLVFMSLLMILTLAKLQIVNGEEYDIKSQKKLLSESKIPAPRGNIIDRNGVPIAVNRQSYAVQIYKPNLKGAQLNAMFLKLVEIFDKNEDGYNNTLADYLTFNGTPDYGVKAKDNQVALDKWKSEMVIKDADISMLSDPQAIFDYFRKTKFKISDEYTDEQAYKIISLRYDMLMKGFYNANTIASDVSRETVAEIEERHDEFSGVSIVNVPYRQYIDSSLISHVLGYVGPIFGEEYKELKDKGYGMNDIIGRAGIEKAAEKFLRGTDGVKRVERDINGRITGELDGKPVEPGSDLMLTIDMNLQKVATESLVNQINEINTMVQDNNYHDASAGAVIVTEVNTGEVLALASYPSYDPSVYLKSKSDKDAASIIKLWENDMKSFPQLNRAISGIYAPGSTFKPLTAIAGLKSQGSIIDLSHTVISDPGTVTYDGHTFFCLEYRNGLGAHGDLTLQRALATSCNIYFHRLGASIGIDAINNWARNFGLGEKTGIELGGESAGTRATREKKVKEDGPWGTADTAQVAIGQFSQAYTPIQLVNYVATIANGGKKFTPHLIKQAIRYDGSTVSDSLYSKGFEQMPVESEVFELVREGMEDVANSADGTATYAFNGLPIKVAGKTGTAETGRENESSNALFVCYAPAQDPKIAISVVIQKGAWGSNCAPVAAEIVKQYFGLNDVPVTDTAKADEAVFIQ